MQPFLIGEAKTGLFNYLEPWQRPLDAFEPLDNAFVYRGSIQKRAGFSVFGRMPYEDVIAVGNGGMNYSGTLLTVPISPGSLVITDGIETFTDTGLGTLTRTPVSGGTNTINYTTGAWSIQFNNNVTAGTLITASYVPQTTSPRAIMGIKMWTNESTGGYKSIIMDTRRAAEYVDSTQTYIPINGVSQVIYQGDGTTPTITVGTGWIALAPYTSGLAPFSISITDGTSTITDDGAGNLSASVNFAAGGTVNYTTGAIHLVFTSAPAITVSITLTATLTGDYFTGTTSNFFNAINWQGQMYMTNNVDPITLYNGLTTPGTLSRPPFSITQANRAAFINNIGTCLDIDVYKNRILVQRPIIINDGAGNGLAPQSIRYSAILNPTNLVADVAGNGGELSAPTDDFIQSSEFLRDQLIVFFTNTTWTFRYTGSDFDPFRWDKINASKSTSAPYGTIDYDERVTAMGSKGLIACDGVNVQRYDVSVIDQFLDINQNAFPQCFGLRFDTLNQSWMLYPSMENNASLSDKVLVYNIIESTWATYSLPLSCLGLYFISRDVTWNDFAVGTPLGTAYPNWDSADIPWNNYLTQGRAPTLLGGSFNGYIYQMNQGETDNGVNITSNITSAKWNPFSTIGQKVQFGWIDFYYEIEPEPPTNPAVITLTFYTDNTNSVTAQRTLTLDGPVGSTSAMKRIYINNIGEFLKMNMNSSSTATFKIFGMVLWAKPSGRWTP